MGSITIALVAFGCICAGMFGGATLRNKLPAHHLRDDSKEVIKVGTGFIATLTALVLGLLVSSGKNSFDAVDSGIVQSGAKVMVLDRILLQYGPEANDLRPALKSTLAGAILHLWPEKQDALAGITPTDPQRGLERLYGDIQKLVPHNDTQKWLQDQARQISSELAQGRWQLIEEGAVPLPTPFLVVLISWLATLFACFNLLAPRNVTVVAVLLLCALSVSGAIFLVVEMSHPESGLMKVSCAPLLKAFSALGQ